MPDPQAQPKHKLRVPRARRGPFRILLGTRKGAFVMDGEGAGRDFEAPRPVILGRTCFHLVRDPFRRDVLLAGVRGPGEGPTVLRSEDAGLTWAEADAPPCFGPAAPDAPYERVVHQVFWLSAGHPNDRDTWFAGTCPQGLFRSDDGGRSWSPVEGLHRHPRFEEWTDLAADRTPDGPKLHSVHVDPRSATRMTAERERGLRATSSSLGLTAFPTRLSVLPASLSTTGTCRGNCTPRAWSRIKRFTMRSSSE